MKKIFTFALFCLSLFSLAAADDVRDVYIRKYASIAVKEMKRTGVPASITLAQGILESNAGRSVLAVEGNNHFGVKCHSDWKGKTLYKPAEKGNECFRAYVTVEESFRDHSDFLRYQNRYKSLFELDKEDYKGWAYGLKKAGYATDPSYPQKLIRIIEEYNLTRFDKGVPVDVPAPLEIETPKRIEDVADNTPYREFLDFSMAREIFVQNGVPFVYAREGETYDSLAKRYNLFRKEILKFNDLTAPLPLKDGEIVYLKAKKKQAAAGMDKYVIGEGERLNLRDVAQRYGVKLSSLEKLNPAIAFKTLKEGDTVILR